jgi:hypothetical protein
VAGKRGQWPKSGYAHDVLRGKDSTHAYSKAAKLDAVTLDLVSKLPTHMTVSYRVRHYYALRGGLPATDMCVAM